jgi:AcrR family transcriptional regulator
VFRRFGSREGLFRALTEERLAGLEEAVRAGPPPLGPGAPARTRLTAFLDAVVEVASANVGLMVAYDRVLTSEERTAMSRHAGPVYESWHAHIATLVAEERPDLDAELLAHVILGSLYSDPLRHLLLRGQSQRLFTTLEWLTAAVLDTPPPGPTGIAPQPRWSAPG